MTGDVAQRYHDRTTHTVAGVSSGGRRMDPRNRPAPFKLYPDRDAIDLPVRWPQPDAAAADVLSGRHDRVAGSVAADLALLARLLFLTGGVTRRVERGGHIRNFRAAPSAGALYPVEVYAIVAGVDGLDDGCYHFEPLEFGLRQLRSGDLREPLAAAVVTPTAATAALTLVVTGIPWRTTWKYGPRGYRHLFWDAGTMLANTLAAAASAGWTPRIATGFLDHEVAHLLGTGDQPFDEFPLAVVTIATDESAASDAGTVPGSGPLPSAELAPLRPEVAPLSPSPREEPGLREVHAAGTLEDPDGVTQWRRELAATAKPASQAVDPPQLDGGDGSDPDTHQDSATTLDAVVHRRGSTRRFDPTAVVSSPTLVWGLACAARAAPLDVTDAGTLLAHRAAVHAVDGVTAGVHEATGGGVEAVAAVADARRLRERSVHACLDQALGGTSAFTASHLANLDRVLAAGGARAYRAAQLEGGIAAGRLQLAAFALGHGGTGLTFYDDELARHLDSDLAPMLVTAVGVPDYRSQPGRPPSELTPLTRAELDRVI